jgi:hypothetical protein
MSDPARTLRSRVDFVLVNSPSFDAIAGDRPIPALDLRLAELTAHFTMETFGLAISDLSVAPDHDAALAGGSKDFCLIQRFGHLFHGGAETAAALLAAADTCAFLTGHIMERGGYYFLHDQCILVNRRAWERLGRPAFGKPDAGRKVAGVPRRSPGNVHDDYTPLFLEPTGETREWQGAFGYGWNAISESLVRGYPVRNWSDAARRWKRNCYAYYGDPAEWQRALADVPAAPPTADAGLRLILDHLRAAPKVTGSGDRIRIVGDAPVADLPHLRLKAGLDAAIAPARGFAASVLLEAIGFHERTAVIHYDPDPAALALRRLMIDTWDGRDLPAFLARARTSLRAEFPNAVLDAETADAAALTRAFHRELAQAFDTEADWLRHWQRARALRHDFIAADPVADPSALTAAIGAHAGGRVVLALGDAFNALPAIARFDIARRRAAYDALVNALKARARLYLVTGQPPRARMRGA